MKSFLFPSTVLLAACATASVACSSSSSTAEEPPRGGGEAVVLQASSTAEAELGVVVWGVDAPSKDLRETTVRGYDASNERVIEIRTKAVQHNATHASLAIGARIPGTTFVAELQLDASLPEIAGQYSENSPQENPLAKRAIAIALSDLNTQSPEASDNLTATRLETNDFGDLVLQLNCLVSPGAILAGIKRGLDVFNDPGNCRPTGQLRDPCVFENDPIAYFGRQCSELYKLDCKPMGERAKKAWDVATSTCDKP